MKINQLTVDIKIRISINTSSLLENILGRKLVIFVTVAQMFLPVGKAVAYLVTENDEEVPFCVLSLPAGEVCFPSLLPLVIPPLHPAVFQMLCLRKGKKRQYSWMQTEESGSATSDEAHVLIFFYLIVFNWVKFSNREGYP